MLYVLDGLIGHDEIIEIKCPYSAKDYTNIFEAINDGKVSCSIKYYSNWLIFVKMSIDQLLYTW